MKPITTSIFILVAFLGLLVTPADARACHGYCREHGASSAAAEASGAGILDAEQEEKIASLRKTFGNKLDKLRSEVAALDGKISKEMSSQEPDAAKLKGLFRERAEAIKQINRLHDQMETKIKNILTDSQTEYYSSRVGGHWCRMGMHGWMDGRRWRGNVHTRGRPGNYWPCCGGW